MSEIQAPKVNIKAKPRKTKDQLVNEQFEALRARLDGLGNIMAEQNARILNLEAALAKITTLTGYGNHLSEFGLERWIPSAKDLRKNRD